MRIFPLFPTDDDYTSIDKNSMYLHLNCQRTIMLCHEVMEWVEQNRIDFFFVERMAKTELYAIRKDLFRRITFRRPFNKEEREKVKSEYKFKESKSMNEYFDEDINVCKKIIDMCSKLGDESIYLNEDHEFVKLLMRMKDSKDRQNRLEHKNADGN